MKKVELMDKAKDFLHSYSMPNFKWFEKGIKTASPTKTEQVSAFRLLGFPKTKLADV